MNTLKPLSPELLAKMCEAVASGCFHCVLSVLAANEIEHGADIQEVAANVMQVAAEMLVDMSDHDAEQQHNKQEGVAAFAALIDEAARIDRTEGGRHDH